jgi:hypothetical protein
MSKATLFFAVFSILTAIEYNTNKTAPLKENESMQEREQHNRFAFWGSFFFTVLFVLSLFLE